MVTSIKNFPLNNEKLLKRHENGIFTLLFDIAFGLVEKIMSQFCLMNFAPILIAFETTQSAFFID